jgi:hypothetical protein
MHSQLVLALFFSQSFAVTFMLFKNVIFSARTFICFWSRTLHPQFATSYFLSWMPCYRCKQRITILGLQPYSNILIEGILLEMLRSKSELDLE